MAWRTKQYPLKALQHLFTHIESSCERPLIHICQDRIARADKKSEIDALKQEIDKVLARMEDDEDAQFQQQRVSNELDQIRKYVDRKDRETERMIYSVTKFARAVGAAKRTAQNTQVALDSSEQESSDSREEQQEQREAARSDDEEMIEV